MMQCLNNYMMQRFSDESNEISKMVINPRNTTYESKK